MCAARELPPSSRNIECMQLTITSWSLTHFAKPIVTKIELLANGATYTQKNIPERQRKYPLTFSPRKTEAPVVVQIERRREHSFKTGLNSAVIWQRP
jgi:hypothetical protein